MSDLKKMMGLDPEVPQIKLRPLESLVAYARNSRTHSPAQVEQLQASMLEWGWTNAVLIDDLGIVAGHGRCMAAEALYKRGEQVKFPNGTPIPIGLVPTLDCSGWSAEQRRAYILADNQLALNAGYDYELLKLELKDLDAAEYNLDLIGFNEDELAELLAEEVVAPPDADPDAAPGLPDEPVCVPGDVWLLGNHKLAVGDCTDDSTWERLMPGEVAQAAWLDPPYNVNQERKNKELDKRDGGSRSRSGAISNDKMASSEFGDFLRDAFTAVFAVLKPGAPIYVSYADNEAENFLAAFREAGFKRQSILAWVKNVQTLGRMDHQSRTESILYGWKPGAGHPWYGGRKITNVLDLGAENPFHQLEDGRWQVRIGDTVMIVKGDIEVESHPTDAIHEPRPARSDLHPTMKPTNLVARTLRNSTRRGDIVVDAFGGSGSTLIAAEQLGLSARIIEIDPRYADVILQRFWHYSGKRPVHAVTGEPFPGEGEERLEQPPEAHESDDDVF